MSKVKQQHSKKQYGFPDEAEIERVIKRMTQPGYRRINKGLKPNATTEERIKYNLCKNIVSHAIKNNLTEEELVQKLGIDQVKLEYVLFCHVNKLTFKELTAYVDILHIPLSIKISNQPKHEEAAS
jgi:hypothetical protein